MSLQLTESQLLLQRTVRDFAEKEIAPKALELDEHEAFPFDIFEGLRGLGLTGIGIDPEYGGSGGGITEGIVAMEEICRAYAGIGTILAVQFGLWGQLVQQFGSDEQRRAFLSPLTEGDMITAFALTEPDAGSDAAAIQTTAERRGGEYVLNGAKTFITCGDVATHLLVIATMDPALRHKGITCFVVPQSAEGLTTNRQRGKLGVRASTTAEVLLEEVRVPEFNRIGEECGGFPIIMEILEASRMSVAAQALGIGQCALDATMAWVRQRKTFGAPLASHQGVQFTLADMGVKLEAARLLTYNAAALRDEGRPFGRQACMAKVFAAEAAMWIATKAVQLHGGYGYFKDAVVERCFRDAKITEIYEGTSEVQRMIIARRMLGGDK